MTGHGRYAGQGKTAVDVLRHVFQLPKRAGHFINDVPRLRQKIPADRRQFDMACRAIQQLEAQIAFQLLHPSRQRCLRQVQAFGIAPDVGSRPSGWSKKSLVKSRHIGGWRLRPPPRGGGNGQQKKEIRGGKTLGFSQFPVYNAKLSRF